MSKHPISIWLDESLYFKNKPIYMLYHRDIETYYLPNDKNLDCNNNFRLNEMKKLNKEINNQRDYNKSESKLGLLYHYLKMIVPALVTIFSVAWLIECLNTILHHQEKADFVFLWVSFSTSNPFNWFAAILLVGVGTYFLLSNKNVKKDHLV